MNRTAQLLVLTIFAATAATIATPTPAQASTSTATMAVSATVLAECVVGATPLAFGNYSGAINNQTASVTVTCTNGTPYTLALNTVQAQAPPPPCAR